MEKRPNGDFAYNVRRIILEQAMRAHVGHIGSALSIADIIAALYNNTFLSTDPGDPDRDRFILSKGHAALAMYAAFFLKRWITEADLNSYCCDGSLLGVHPECGLKGVDFSTGSLGHGLSMGAGAALAARLQGSSRRVFVLASDAECNEGSLWEAAMFLAHHLLSNTVLIIDVNGQQAFGYTDDVIKTSPLAQRWLSFGWEVHEVDGHDVAKIADTISGLNCVSGKPHVILAKTVFGKGVSYMEGRIKWHYWPMSEEEYKKAIEEINVKER